MEATVQWIPAARLAIVKAADGRRYVMQGIKSQAEAEAAKETAIARWEEADREAAEREAEKEAKRQEWDADRAAEAIAQAVAKAVATPSALKFLAFLKLVKHKETVPYFAEILAEMERLRDADAEVEEEEEGE